MVLDIGYDGLNQIMYENALNSKHIPKYIHASFKTKINNRLYKEQIQFVKENNSLLVLHANSKQIQDINKEDKPYILIETLVNDKNLDLLFSYDYNFTFDTNHTFNAGYDVLKTLTKFKSKIKLVHLNDSLTEFNSGKDLHGKIGQGYLFKDNEKLLIDILKFCDKNSIPIILESKEFDYEIVVKWLYSLLGYKYKIKKVVQMPNFNIDLTLFLKQKAFKEGNKFKRQAVLNGANIISALDFKVEKSDDLIGLKYIGEGIRKKVDLFFKSTFISDDVKVDLKNVTKNNHIPSSLVKKIVSKVLKDLNLTNKYVIAGSYRRGKDPIADIDVIVIGNNSFSKNGTKKKSIFLNSFSDLISDQKMNKIPIQIDLLFLKYKKDLAPALLYFTGSKEFNVRMRGIAKKMGYKLNEYGLFKNGGKFNTPTEKSIFKILGMEYVLPFNRI